MFLAGNIDLGLGVTSSNQNSRLDDFVEPFFSYAVLDYRGTFQRTSGLPTASTIESGLGGLKVAQRGTLASPRCRRHGHLKRPNMRRHFPKRKKEAIFACRSNDISLSEITWEHEFMNVMLWKYLLA
jgi:hypothetical protein